MNIFRAALIAVSILSSCAAYSAGNISAADEQAVSSIVLRNGWMYFISPDGSIIMQQQISEVRTIVFSETPVGTIATEFQSDGISIYPNPAQNLLHINCEAEAHYQMFDLDGRCLFQGKGSTIDVAPLKTGTYLLQVNNKTYKFIKP